MELSRRHLLAAAPLAAAGAAAPAWAQTGAFTPEQFGAKGDGVTNDTDAFARMAEALSRRGGGEVLLRRATYIVGRQTQAFRSRASYAFEPSKIMEFVGLRGGLTIRGNGAKLKAAPGLRYGTFNPATGARTRNAMPYIKPGELATPYRAMIRVEKCAGPVEITDLELDGNLKALQVGGQYGDTGWQIPGTGLLLVDNSGTEKVARVYAHHHPQDGVTINGLDRSRGSAAASLFEDVHCAYNGRQGVSLVGGRGYSFRGCKFNHTGKGGIASAPGGGVDIEAEGGKKVRDISFSGCEFANNEGAGMVADTGDSEGVSFDRCTFVGATSWSVWPNKPRFRFTRCTFVGALTRAHGDPQPERATQFHDCTFRDDPALSPTGRVFGGANTDRPIADLPGNRNVLFSRCRFQLTHQAVLPWSVNVTYADCTFSQRSQTISYPRGFFVGRNRMDARAGISGSLVEGELILNGKPMPRGRIP
jgi:hypothetical protein